MRKKEGFSLVELIIVLGIMAIMTGLAAFGFGYFRLADAKELANQINSGLSDLKTENMAKSNPVYMHLYEYDGDYYIAFVEDKEGAGDDPTECPNDGTGNAVGDSGISITYNKEGAGGGSSSMVSLKGNPLCFNIQKKDGSFTAIGDKPLPEEIYISADGFDYKITIVKDTGRHYVEG